MFNETQACCNIQAIEQLCANKRLLKISDFRESEKTNLAKNTKLSLLKWDNLWRMNPVHREKSKMQFKTHHVNEWLLLFSQRSASVYFLAL